MINLLLGVASPRDIPEVLNEHLFLPCAIYMVKYKAEWDAYFEIRKFFLDHKEYTHLAIVADDVVVKPNDIKKLVEDLVQNDYEVLTGMMNVFQDNWETVNITPADNIPEPEWKIREYKWYKREDVVDTGIIQVGFSGFPVTVIRRSVVEQIPFDSDGAYNGGTVSSSGSLDVMFCKSCAEKGIKIYVDTSVVFLHLRATGTNMVGKKHPDFWFKEKDCINPQRDPVRNKMILKKKLDQFLSEGGLHHQSANDLLESMANLFLEG